MAFSLILWVGGDGETYYGWEGTEKHIMGGGDGETYFLGGFKEKSLNIDEVVTLKLKMMEKGNNKESVKMTL